MKAFKVGNTVVEVGEHFCVVESEIRFDLVDHLFDSGSAIVIFRNFNEPRFMRVDSVERDNCDEEAFVGRRFLGDWVVLGELNADESSAVMCECPELFPTLHETLHLPEILTTSARDSDDETGGASMTFANAVRRRNQYLNWCKKLRTGSATPAELGKQCLAALEVFSCLVGGGVQPTNDERWVCQIAMRVLKRAKFFPDSDSLMTFGKIVRLMFKRQDFPSPREFAKRWTISHEDLALPPEEWISSMSSTERT